MAERAVAHWLIASLAAMVVVLAPSSTLAQPPLRTVLILHWSTEDFPTTPVMNAAIREAIKSAGTPVDIHDEYLESDRFPEQTAALALREYIRRKYEGRRIDVVLAISEPALHFALGARPELFEGAPIVYSGITAMSGRIRAENGGLAGVISGAGYAATA